MKKSDRVFLGVCVMMSVGALAYCSVGWFGISLPRYYPLENAWKIGKEPGVPSMGWYAGQAFALALGVLAGWAVHFAAGFFRRPSLSPAAVKAVAVATLLVLAGCLGYLMAHEFKRFGVVSAASTQTGRWHPAIGGASARESSSALASGWTGIPKECGTAHSLPAGFGS